MSNPNRVQAGVPSSGQFAAGVHAESAVALRPTPPDHEQPPLDAREYDRAYRDFTARTGELTVDELQQRISSFGSPTEFAEWRSGPHRKDRPDLAADYQLFVTADAQVAPPMPETGNEDELNNGIRTLEMELSDESDVVRLARYAPHEHPWVRTAVAANPNTLQSTLRRLAVDEAPLTRRAAAAHLTDPDALLQRASDTDPLTAKAARSRRDSLTHRDRQIHAEVVADFAHAKAITIDSQRVDDWAQGETYLRYAELLQTAKVTATGLRRMDVKVSGPDTDIWGYAASELLDAATADNPKVPDTAHLIEITAGHYALIW